MSGRGEGPGEGLYRILLRLYPKRFRDEYGADLIQAYRDRAAEPRFRGLGGRARLVGYLCHDLARSLLPTHRQAGKRRPASRRATDRWATDPWATGRWDGARGGALPSDLLQDLRFALRAWRRRPGFLLACIVTLALGIGASVTVFSVADGVALRPLPYPASDRLVAIGGAYEGRQGPGPSTPADFLDWQSRSRTIEAMAASRLEGLTLLGAGDPIAVSGAGVSSAFFAVLGVEPAVGRAFAPRDDRPDARPVAVLAHGIWQRRFGSDPGLLGRTLSFDERSFTVVGVMPPAFHPPEALYHGDVEVWYPLAHVEEDLQTRSSAFLQAVGRLAAGVTVEEARRELQDIADAVRSERTDAGDLTAAVAPLRDLTVGEVGPTLAVLLGAVGFLLLIACANVANLLLMRATERDRELALRTALGAERGRLMRQLLTEGLLLALLGGALAVAVAYGGLAVFKATNPGDLPRLSEVGIDLRVLLFALGLSLSTGILFGLVPLGRSSGTHMPGALREGPATSSSGLRAHRLRDLLVVGQTAVALVLLVGAGLLMNSFARLRAVDPGFEPGEAVWIHVSVPSEDYPTPGERLAFFGEVRRRFAALPGVHHVGGTENLPLGRNSSAGQVSPEGLELATGEDPPVLSYHRITPGFFRALGTSLLRGRAFADTDDGDSEPVAIVNRALAGAFWPGADPLGRRVRFGRPDGQAPWMTVVGVVEDIRQGGLGTAPGAELYIPWMQSPRTNVSFVVRGPAASAELLPRLTREVRAVDPTLPVERLGTLGDHVAANIVGPRFYMLLVSTFAAVALVLAAVGLYGTMAYAVERRTHELGVRIALGADRGRVLGDVVRDGATLVVAGLALGFPAALLATRALEGFVFGITPTDPPTLAGTAALLGAVGALACWLPARRATRLDPVRALRSE